jgi:hypothetical protein
VHDQTVVGFVLSHLAGVLVERVEHHAEGTSVFALARAETATCPSCATVSTSVRGRYQRRLADTPVGGRQVWLILRVRRFNCPYRRLRYPHLRRAGTRPDRPAPAAQPAITGPATRLIFMPSRCSAGG